MSDNTARQTNYRPEVPTRDSFSTALANLAAAGIGFEVLEGPTAPEAGPRLQPATRVAEAA